jgi:hypothetical protein
MMICAIAAFDAAFLPHCASIPDTAYEWLCRRRRDYSANSDVWALRRDWPRQKERIKGELTSGNYRFSLLTRITLKDRLLRSWLGRPGHEDAASAAFTPCA